MNIKKTLLILFLVGIIWRIIFLLIGYYKSGPEFMTNYGDSGGYMMIAENMLLGHGFSQSSKAPFLLDSVRTPGYPLFLMLSLLVSYNFWFAIAIQILIGSLIPVLAYYLILELNFDRHIAFFSTVFLVFEPFLASQSVFLLSDTLFIFFFIFSLYCFMRYINKNNISNILMSGIFIGLGILVRPVGLYVIPILIFYLVTLSIYLKRTWMLSAIIFLIISITIITPWLIRNYKEFGSLRLSSIDYYNIYFFEAGSTLALEENVPFETVKIGLQSELIKQGVDYNSITSSSLLRNKAISVFKNYPLSFLKISIITLAQFFTHDAYYDLAKHLGFYKYYSSPPITVLNFTNSIKVLPFLFIKDPLFIFFVLGRLLWIGIFFAFLGGLIISWQSFRYRAGDILAIILILYFAATSLTTGYSVNARFRLPVVVFYTPYLFIFCFYIFMKIKSFYIKN